VLSHAEAQWEWLHNVLCSPSAPPRETI
jgi:hypothetical protein